MSVANCPETPRQKMISMMYLVLTAMLAINLAPEVLEGFLLVNKGLETTNTNTQERNTSIYQMMDALNQKDPLKAKDLNDKAIQIRKLSDEMVGEIQNCKELLATGANGGVKINPDSLSKNDIGNQDVPSLMLPPNSHEGSILHGKYFQFREAVKRIIETTKASTPVISNINKIIDIKGPDAPDAKLWEYGMFEARPVITSLTLLTKLQNDVRNVETVSIQHLLAQVGASDFKVDKFKAIIIPNSNYILKGQALQAQILVTADINSSSMIKQVKHDDVDVSKDDMSYTIPASSVGFKTTNINIVMERPDGTIDTLTQTLQYQVAEANATVSATKMNVFYAGVENPIQVSAPGVSADKIKVSSSAGSISIKGTGLYEIKPSNAAIGTVCTIDVSAEIDGKVLSLAHSPFRVKRLPDPVVYIPNGTHQFYSGTIARDVLLGAPKLLAQLKDSEFDAAFIVTSFTVNAYDAMGNSKFETSTGANFTSSQKDLLRKLKKGSKIYISKLKVSGPDGARDLTGSMEIVIN